MDDRLRQLERAALTGTRADQMAYYAALLRAGREIKMPAHPEGYSYVKRGRVRHFDFGPAYTERYYLAKFPSGELCKHQHSASKDAWKCARRHAREALLKEINGDGAFSAPTT